jgi:Major Facilitator Superfamily
MRLNSRLFLSVSLVSGFGNTSMFLAAPVWTLALTGDSTLAATCGFLVYLPTVFGPALGSLVDRVDRKRLLILTNVAMAATLSALLAVHDEGDLWILFAVMLGYGISHVLNDSAEAALLPAALPAGELGRLNGMRMSAQEGMKLVAPLAGAALFTWAGGPAVAAVSIAALGVSAFLYSRIRPAGTVVRAARARIREGLTFLWRHRTIRDLVLVSSTAAAMSGLGTAAIYTVVVKDLALDPAFLGVLPSAQGAGSIVGGILAGRSKPRAGLIGSVIFAAGTLTRFLPGAPVAVAGSVLIGIGLPWTVVAAMTAVQTGTPQAMLGRVAASASTLVFAPIAVAIPLGAALAEAAGHRLTLAFCALATLAPPSLLMLKERLAGREARRPNPSYDASPDLP